jgi:predicted dehydrogenase
MVASGALVPWSDNDVVVYGSKGKIFCKGTLGTPQKGKPQEVLLEGAAAGLQVRCPADDTAQGRTARLIEEFNRSIRDNTDTVIPGHNGLQMVRIANAMLESSRHGKSVRL